ncbi:DASH complex subunit ASK1 [Abortiporus biennis]
MAPPLKPIEPKSTRWEATPDPNDIVIPGLDTTAPVNDQIEQIEQLITIKLQNVDANFSKIQQIMANRILPAVKRYAVGTEPVREAARFWVTFFEQAAQIRVPGADDFDIHEEPSSSQAPTDTEEEEQQTNTSASEHPDDSSSHSQMFDPNSTPSEVSFAPGQAAVSSTPATASRFRTHDGSDSEPTPSWSASFESPLIRLDREIQSLAKDEVSVASSSMLNFTIQDPDESAEVTQRQILHPPLQQAAIESSNTGKSKERSKEPPKPLLHNVLRRNASVVDSSSATGSNTTVSPLKLKQKTPISKKMNPYLPPDSKPSDWKGVVDLKDPTVSTPRRTHLRPSANMGSTTPGYNEDDSFDESFGLSPPVTMHFARLPTLGRTPKKEAAERIMKDIIDVERRGVFGATRGVVGRGGSTTESSMSTVPTPPSLSRYIHGPPETSSSVADASLESLMRRVKGGFSNEPQPISVTSTTSLPSIPSIPRVAAQSIIAPQVAVTETPVTPEPPQFNVFRLQDDEYQPQNQFEDDPDSSSDDIDQEEAAVLLASQRASYEDDDSFDSMNQSIDSLEEEPGSDAPVHPFARGFVGEGGDDDVFDDEDSFDDPGYGQGETEETLFGVPPAQRLARQAMAQARMSEGNLRMLGEELLEDTIGVGAQMVRAGRVEESPLDGRGGTNR